MQITYLNSVVMPDEDTSGSSDEESDGEEGDAERDSNGAAADDEA
jgi:hypothetical protein